MGHVDIPELVLAGRSRVSIELTRSELEVALDLLKAAVHYLALNPGSLNPASASSAPGVQQQSNVDVATAGISCLRLKEHEEAPAGRKSLAAVGQQGRIGGPPPGNPWQPITGLGSSVSPYVTASVPPHIVRSPVPNGKHSKFQRSTSNPALPPGSLTDGQLAHLAAGPLPSEPKSQQPASMPSNAAAPAGRSGLARISDIASPWKLLGTTAAAEHSRDAITAMTAVASLEGLVGGDAHAGWLLTASRKILNLWECNPGGNPTEPPLQVMHSQAVDYAMQTIDLGLGNKVMLAGGTQYVDGANIIALHSLAPETFLAPKGKIRLPPSGAPAARQPGAPSLCHVASLQPLGGPLSSSVVTASGGDVVIYDLSAASQAPRAFTPPKAAWPAHDAPITCLHRSAFACALFTGSNDGFVRLWDLKTKPSAPVRQYVHRRYVTSVEMLDANIMASASADGTIQIWDIRGSTGNEPLNTFIPDNKPIVTVGLSAVSDKIAIGTMGGLYCINFGFTDEARSGATIAPLVPLPPTGPCLHLKWNEQAGLIYVSSRDGTVSVYGKISG